MQAGYRSQPRKALAQNQCTGRPVSGLCKCYMAADLCFFLVSLDADRMLLLQASPCMRWPSSFRRGRTDTASFDRSTRYRVPISVNHSDSKGWRAGLEPSIAYKCPSMENYVGLQPAGSTRRPAPNGESILYRLSLDFEGTDDVSRCLVQRTVSGVN
jgi:hypothetical protein